VGGFCKVAERGKEGHRQTKFTGERGNSGQKQYEVAVLKVEIGRVTLECKARVRLQRQKRTWCDDSSSSST